MNAQLELYGFNREETGGGASAYIINTGSHDVYVTDGDGNATHDPAAPIFVAWYAKDDSSEAVFTRDFESAEAMFAWFEEACEDAGGNLPLCAVLDNLDGFVGIKGG